MGYGSRKIKILALLSAILFSWYWCSTTLFYHSHLIDGEQIFHSHPYTGTPSSHGHTAGALQTISYLSLLTVVLASLATVPMGRIQRIQTVRRPLHKQKPGPDTAGILAACSPDRLRQSAYVAYVMKSRIRQDTGRYTYCFNP